MVPRQKPMREAYWDARSRERGAPLAQWDSPLPGWGGRCAADGRRPAPPSRKRGRRPARRQKAPQYAAELTRERCAAKLTRKRYTAKLVQNPCTAK
eukprot:gene13257-biopygen1427